MLFAGWLFFCILLMASLGSRTGPFICGGVLNGLHLGLFYCCLSRGKLLCVFSLADSFLSTFIRVRASQWCSGENHQAYTGSEDRKRRNKNHNKTVTVEVNSRNLLSSFLQSWHLKWRHSQMGSHSQVLLVFFDSVSGDSVWMMMLLLLGCVDRITGLFAPWQMCQPQLRAWPSPLVHLGARSPLIHLSEGHQDVLWPCLPNPESAGGTWKEEAPWRAR